MSTPVAIYASLAHYWDHLAPVADALRSATTAPLRGVESPPGRPWGTPLRRGRSGAIWLVASAADAKRVGPGVPVIYLEHGAGQSYHGDERARTSGSYAGGDGLDDVILFLCPHETVAARWRARYPDTPAVVVGSPRLDRWHEDPFITMTHQILSKPVGAGPVVAVTFHWPNSLCPESQWALPHYRSHLHDLRTAVEAAGGELIGHGHPRAWRQLRREWVRHGIRPVEHLDDVFDRADVLVADNTSAAVEFASLGRPIVWLSAPWYRRDVVHGGRFWEWTDGMPHVERPEDLVPTVLAVLADGGAAWADGHARMVASAYDRTDGLAAQRAAGAIMEATTRWATRTHPG